MELMTKQGYKQTEVGLIPEDWDAKRIGDIALIERGKFTPRPRNNPIYYGGEIPFVQTGDVTRCNGKISHYSQTLNKIGLGVSKLFPKGSILMTIAANIGYTGVLQIDMACPDSLIGINGKQVENEFLNFYFQFRRNEIEELSTSGAQKNLNIELFRPFLIPIPPTLTEQKAIATALSDVDAFIASLEQTITKKKAIKQGAMQQLLNPPHKGGKRLTGFSGDWVEKTLGDVSHIKTGSRNNQDKVEDGEYPFYVRSQSVKRIDTYSYDEEAILIPGEGGIGTIFHYINGKFEVHQRVYKISSFSEGVLGKFIFLKMKHEFYEHAMTNSVKATVDSLRLPTFQEFEICLPPALDEQKAIAQILSDMDAEITQLETKKEKHQAIKQGMMQELLTGKTRLV
jgi:type I restriction enzyme S subunit